MHAGRAHGCFLAHTRCHPSLTLQTWSPAHAAALAGLTFGTGSGRSSPSAGAPGGTTGWACQRCRTQTARRATTCRPPLPCCMASGGLHVAPPQGLEGATIAASGPS